MLCIPIGAHVLFEVEALDLHHQIDLPVKFPCTKDTSLRYVKHQIFNRFPLLSNYAELLICRNVQGDHFEEIELDLSLESLELLPEHFGGAIVIIYCLPEGYHSKIDRLDGGVRGSQRLECYIFFTIAQDNEGREILTPVKQFRTLAVVLEAFQPSSSMDVFENTSNSSSAKKVRLNQANLTIYVNNNSTSILLPPFLDGASFGRGFLRKVDKAQAQIIRQTLLNNCKETTFWNNAEFNQAVQSCIHSSRALSSAPQSSNGLSIN